MQINKDKLKNRYSLLIIAIAIAMTFIYNVLKVNQQELAAQSKPEFFNRMPTNFKKIRQHINIEIDYEKLPGRNQIRLIGKVNRAHMNSDILDYKWTLKNNLILQKGALSGRINLQDTNEIILDVAIKNMKKKVKVKLQATVPNTKIKISSVQNFTFDPKDKTLQSDTDETEQNKLSKKEILEKALQIPRKPSLQQ